MCLRRISLCNRFIQFCLSRKEKRKWLQYLRNSCLYCPISIFDICLLYSEKILYRTIFVQPKYRLVSTHFDFKFSQNFHFIIFCDIEKNGALILWVKEISILYGFSNFKEIFMSCWVKGGENDIQYGPPPKKIVIFFCFVWGG